MDWIDFDEDDQNLSFFKKIDKVTLYDHNSTIKIDEINQSFTCLLNCKKLNRTLSTICKIKGEFKKCLVVISCLLINQQGLVGGKWQFEKIQLMRFAYRYNERSYRNIYIKVNPKSGQIEVGLQFSTGLSILEDEQKFKEVLTDLCQVVGEESQKIFNSMSEIILGRQAKEPYLKSAIKVSPSFPRYMKVEKLLDKIKSLIATSSHYKIKADISTAHKNRSYFKKVFLNKKELAESQKQSKIIELALLYELKYNRKYDEPQLKPKDKAHQFIKDYTQLEEKNQIQFAKHLNEGNQIEFDQYVIEDIQIVKRSQNERQFQLSGGRRIRGSIKQLSKNELKHQLEIVAKIGCYHNCMSRCRRIAGTNSLFYDDEEVILIEKYLSINKKVISLATRLHLIAQICSFFVFLHKKRIGYLIELANIYVGKNLQIKIRGFKNAFCVKAWKSDRQATENRQKDNKKKQKVNLEVAICNQLDLIYFPYRCVDPHDMDNQKCDIHSLGVCLYKILMDKFPFDEKVMRTEEMRKDDQKPNIEWWKKAWVVQTEYFLAQGGEIVKMIGHLLLKCLDLDNLNNRPFVEWVMVIICEIKTSLNGLY